MLALPFTIYLPGLLPINEACIITHNMEICCCKEKLRQYLKNTLNRYHRAMVIVLDFKGCVSLILLELGVRWENLTEVMCLFFES